jgi:putative endonuclease
LSFPRKWESILELIVKQYYVYILASKKNGVLYIGMTNDLRKRVFESKNNLVDGFTERYNVNKLVYFELTNQSQDAINREKRLKKWKRRWKIELIESMNPEWKDLYFEKL